MKKILSAILILVMSMCISCSDDFDTYSELDKLLGTWKCEEIGYSYIIEVNRGTDTSTDEAIHYGSYYVVYENGDRGYRYHNLLMCLIYKQKDILCFVKSSIPFVSDKYQYQLKGNVLTIDDKTFHKVN